MEADPVVQELRNHGAQVAKECGGDIHRMAERFRRQQTESTRRIVHRDTCSRRRRSDDAASRTVVEALVTKQA